MLRAVGEAEGFGSCRVLKSIGAPEVLMRLFLAWMFIVCL